MKKLFMVMVMVIGLSSVANAASEYDGIWQVDQKPGTVISIYENNGTMVAFVLDNEHMIFDTVLGTLNGNTIIASSLADFSVTSYTYKVVFTSLTSMYMEQLSCKPLYEGWTCEYPNGTRINASKLF